MITEVAFVEVKADGTTVFGANSFNKTHHPIVVPMEDLKANKRDQYSINPVKISPEDKGDGISRSADVLSISQDFGPPLPPFDFRVVIADFRLPLENFLVK